MVPNPNSNTESSTIVTEWIRVDIPNHPDAIASSAYGSVLLNPPQNGIAWHYQSMAVVDREEQYIGAIQPTATYDALNIVQWHDAGFLGQNVSIAVFDVEWMGIDWENPEIGAIETHDCFSHPSCAPIIDSTHPRFGFERGVHGVACTEVIRDIAPEAEVHAVRVLGLTSLENAVDWAIEQKIDIISMSLSFFNNSFYDGTGPINQLMNRLAEHDVLMVTSAGNYARGHYRAQYNDWDWDGLHDFNDHRGLPIYWGEGLKSINVIWDDFANCGTHDLNAFVYNRNGELIAKSTRLQSTDSESCYPSETVMAQIDYEDWYFLQIQLESGESWPNFDIMTKGGLVHQSHRDGSIVDPGTHPSVLTVGAVRVDDYLFSSLEGFSSFGPTNNGLTKPDVVGPDGLSTLTYGPKNFFGTSASTPATAATLALYKSAHPELSNYDVAQAMKALAIQDNPNQITTEEMGYGRIKLPNLDSQNMQCMSSFSPFMMLLFYALFKKRKHPSL